MLARRWSEYLGTARILPVPSGNDTQRPQELELQVTKSNVGQSTI